MCDVMLTDGITHPPEPAAPVSFKGSKVTVWVMDAVLGLQMKREHVAEWWCRTQHATAASHLHFRLLISKSRLVEPPQIVSPHPCSLNPLKFMMPTLKELHKHAARSFSPEVLVLQLVVAGSSCTTQPGPELFSSVGLSVPPTRGHSVTPELRTLCKILHE